MIATDSFLPLARAIAKQEGFENLPVVTIPHPIGGREPAALDESLAGAVDAVVDALLTSPEAEAGDTQAMAQAAHGSAPDIAGRGIANPVGMLVSAAMLMSWLGSGTATPPPSRSARGSIGRSTRC